MAASIGCATATARQFNKCAWLGSRKLPYPEVVQRAPARILRSKYRLQPEFFLADSPAGVAETHRARL